MRERNRAEMKGKLYIVVPPKTIETECPRTGGVARCKVYMYPARPKACAQSVIPSPISTDDSTDTDDNFLFSYKPRLQHLLQTQTNSRTPIHAHKIKAGEVAGTKWLWTEKTTSSLDTIQLSV